ncbi:T7SS effector LXG polymorphic toxin [Staphylococcus edaphicus]|uniref:LXG domain-containing protein n=1 Tax=Staphylococcus edaphicus TaxID=1955013 RepID=A0ABY4QCA4_9STAP|nr:T7SS effector LXG polymorphic toxin [Staphylococcus edaphicus]UQW81655.1 LXG domain-containing protein [Staphylococcus edaphicus]
MGSKVKMAEVHDLYDSISKALNNLSTNTKTLKSSLDDLKSDDNFKGQTAKSINNYNDSFHVETIDRLDKIKEEFEKTFKKSIEAFHSDVDSDHSAILKSDAMETYKDDIDKSVENIEQTKVKMNGAIGGVHDLTTAKTITGSDVKDKGKALSKHIKNTVNDFESFQNSHASDDIDLLTMIAPVATMASKVKDMPSNRSTIAKNSAYIKSQYTLHSKNNQFVQLKEELEKFENAAYGGKKSAKVVKAMMEMKRYWIAGLIAGEGNFSKGNQLLKNSEVSKIGKKKLKLINSVLSTNVENVKNKRLVKAAEFMMKNPKGMKKSDKFLNALKMTQNFDDKELKSVRKIMGNPSPKGIFKTASKAALDEVISENTRGLIKNPKGVKDFALKELADFKSKNFLGKSLKSLKYFGKGLGPIGTIAAVGSNAVSEKSAKRKVVDSVVDVGAIAATTGTGAAIGAAVGGPFGAGVGVLAGVGLGVLSEVKIFNGKSATDIAKDKANEMVNSVSKSDAWKKTQQFGGDVGKGMSNFGKSLGKLF